MATNPPDVATTIASLSRRLGLPQRDICEAAAVNQLTYHTRLQALVQFTEDLEELLDVPPIQWLLARPERRAQLLAGRFDDLLESLRASPRPPQAAPDVARFLSVGGDRLASDAEPAALRRPPRKSTSAETVSHSRRCKG